MNKDVKELVKKLHRNGLKTRITGAGHVGVLDPAQDNRRVYSFPSTPSSNSWRINAEADLERLGLLSRHKVKRDAGGQTPPPLPDLAWKEEPMDIGPYEVKESPGTHRKFAVVNTKMIDAAAVLFDEIATEYGMKPRGDRATAHGTSAALAQVMMAYETASEDPIPSFNYKEKDNEDRELMALLAARRAANFVHIKAGTTNVSPVTVSSLDYALEAWDWFKSLDYKFPDGRIIYMHGQGLVIQPTQMPDEPDTPAPEVEVDPWATLKAEIEGPKEPAHHPADPSYPDRKAAEPEQTEEEAEAALATWGSYVDAGIPEARILLAIRVAASIPDAYLAEQIAKEVLYG